MLRFYSFNLSKHFDFYLIIVTVYHIYFCLSVSEFRLFIKR